MGYNIDEQDILDLITNDDLKHFIKSYFDIDHIYFKKYDYIHTVIVE